MVLYFFLYGVFRPEGEKRHTQGKIPGQRESYTFETLPNYESQKVTVLLNGVQHLSLFR